MKTILNNLVERESAKVVATFVAAGISDSLDE